MTASQLKQIHELLTVWIAEPNWNKASQAWANIVETRRQVEIDLWEVEPDWTPD